MNSWPIRWAAVIRAKTRPGQESGLGLGDGEAGLAAERAVAVLTVVPAGPAAGWLAPEEELHPEQARAAMSVQPRKVPATRCPTTTLISPRLLCRPRTVPSAAASSGPPAGRHGAGRCLPCSRDQARRSATENEAMSRYARAST